MILSDRGSCRIYDLFISAIQFHSFRITLYGNFFVMQWFIRIIIISFNFIFWLLCTYISEMDQLKQYLTFQFLL